MNTYRTDDPVTEHVTVIEERGSRGNGGVIIGIIALLLIALGGFWLLSQRGADPSDANIAAAADKVGAAAEEVGDAATNAADKLN